MTGSKKLQRSLKRRPRKWLVTGAAGFIGSHLVETLLRLNQRVAGLDNFATDIANKRKHWSSDTKIITKIVHQNIYN